MAESEFGKPSIEDLVRMYREDLAAADPANKKKREERQILDREVAAFVELYSESYPDAAIKSSILSQRFAKRIRRICGLSVTEYILQHPLLGTMVSPTGALLVLHKKNMW